MNHQCDYCGDDATWIVWDSFDDEFGALMCDCCQFEYSEYFPSRAEYCERIEGSTREQSGVIA